MTGRLTVVGLGPGPSDWVTPAARAAIESAEVILGYSAYTERLTPRAGQTIEASDNREEIARGRRALELAAQGKIVAVVSGGDPGVFAMAAAVFEALESGPADWRHIDIRVEPGVTAMLAAAARIGAPLGHDFCAISLSNNLKPWPLIEKRLNHAAEGDFVISLYNPASKARPGLLTKAFNVLLRHCSPETAVVFARAVGRGDEHIEITTLSEAHSKPADMRTLVLVGSRSTRCIAKPGGTPWVYTPRYGDEA